ncbi:MAG: PAS domain S-box protein [Gammaproteobacteria bacterium]
MPPPTTDAKAVKKAGAASDGAAKGRTREDLERLARLPAEAPHPIMRADASGRLLYANPASQTLLRHWRIRRGRLLPQSVKDTLKYALEDNAARHMDVNCGDRVFSLVFTPTPKAAYVNVWGQDITDQRKAEKALEHFDETFQTTARAVTRNEQQRLRDVLENMPDGVLVVDPTMSCVACNEQVTRLLKLPDGLLEEGKSILPMLRHMARRGDYGPGDSDTLANDRLDQALQFLDLHGSGMVELEQVDGTIIELRMSQNAKGEKVSIYTDITERRRAEKQHRQLFEAIPYGISVSSSTDDKLLYMNAAGQRLLGIKPEDVHRTAASECYTIPGEREKVWRTLKTKGKIEGMELSLKGADGQIFPALSYGQTIEFEGENAWLGIIVDITELKAAQKELRGAEERQRQILNAIPFPMGVSKWREGKLLYLNTVGQEALGVPEDKIAETHAASMYANLEDQERLSAAIKEDGRVEGMEMQIRKGDGDVFPGLVYAMRLEYQGEDAVLGTAIDVTEIKAAENRFRALLESAPDAMVIVDKHGSIVLANTRTRDLFGYEPEELANKKVEVLMPERFRARHRGHRYRFHAEPMARAMGVGMELFGRARDGREFPIEISLSPIETEQGTLVAGAIRDISTHMAAQQELRQARDDAEQAARAKAAFLATMSHEIRTPMNGVVGMIDLLGQTPMNEEQGQMLTTIKESAFSLLNIIDDILDFSKIEAGKLNMEYIPISIKDLAEGVAETLTPSADKQGLDLVCFVDPEIPRRVMGEQVRLRQILFNLVGNAIKFTAKGVVVIRADRIGAAGNRIIVRYQVIDEGVGIPADKLGSLFKPFSQAESSTTRRFGGTGLGLTICKSLTDMMEGEITVESELGAGSTFTVTLRHEVVVVEEHSDIKNGLDGVRVLLAMKDIERREFIQRYLEFWRAGVCATTDLGEAQSIAREAAAKGEPVHVIVQGLAWSNQERKRFRDVLRADERLSKTRFVSLRGERSRLDRTDIIDAITVEAMPLRRSSVLRAVAIAAGRASPEVIYDDDHAIGNVSDVLPTVEEAEARGELILVAEDNLTNQDVIRRQLNVLGFAADIAADGKEALTAWKSKAYAVLLTDCHMPELDGYELTGAIREIEKKTGKRLPIIAITANALEGEGEKCLEAGMDDYLTKPVEMTKLKRTLSKWMPSNGASRGENTGKSSARTFPEAAPAGPIDLTFLRECFGDDREMQQSVLEDFSRTTPDYMGNLQDAAAGGRARDVASVAHTVKSAARTVGAHELADLCQALEQAGKEEDWEEIGNLAAGMQPVMDRIAGFISEFKQQPVHAS